MASDQFQQFLNSSFSNGNDVRQQAEQTYNSVPRELKGTRPSATIHNRQQLEERFGDLLPRMIMTTTETIEQQEILKITSVIELKEITVSLSENVSAMIRRRAEKYIALLIPFILQMMTDMEDDEEWTISDMISDDDTSENNVIVESSLNRLPHVMKTLS
ncbi:hypothetical protein GQX74_011499 [Glossina fuscipes]|nr:hypothetical protein GQX74_011499 [Glossina fuscipes]